VRCELSEVWVLLPPYTHLGDVEEIFNPLGVSLGAEISLIRLIKIFATVLILWCADLIHWGFLDAF